jgi:hypothetical protein
LKSTLRSVRRLLSLKTVIVNSRPGEPRIAGDQPPENRGQGKTEDQKMRR